MQGFISCIFLFIPSDNQINFNNLIPLKTLYSAFYALLYNSLFK